MNKTLIGFVAVVGVLGLAIGFGVGWSAKPAAQTGGDFPGGQAPSQLLSASVSGGAGSGYVTPVGNLAMLPTGAIGAGGQAANNAVTEIYTAVATYPWTPSSTSAITLGPIQSTTSTAVTQLAFTSAGFVVGDACEVFYNGASTTATQGFGADAFVTAVSGNAVTSTVTFWNGATSTIPLNVTSTASGVTSTLKVTCFHAGV
jgi:hypothetical protein